MGALHQGAENTFPSGGRETEVLPRSSGARASCRRFRDTRTTRDTSASGSSTLTAKVSHDIFKFLEANDIGQRHALFYEAYAAFLEIRGAYARAHEVSIAAMMRAQPRERLKDKLAQFQHRMMRRKQRELEEGTGGDDAEEDRAPGRERRFGTRRRRAPPRRRAENREAPRAGGGAAIGTRAREACEGSLCRRRRDVLR